MYSVTCATLKRTIAAVAQSVERILGKDEVSGSNPLSSFLCTQNQVKSIYSETIPLSSAGIHRSRLRGTVFRYIGCALFQNVFDAVAHGVDAVRVDHRVVEVQIDRRQWLRPLRAPCRARDQSPAQGRTRARSRAWAQAQSPLCRGSADSSC